MIAVSKTRYFCMLARPPPFFNNKIIRKVSEKMEIVLFFHILGIVNIDKQKPKIIGGYNAVRSTNTEIIHKTRN
jgi:hypothetical protein